MNNASGPPAKAFVLRRYSPGRGRSAARPHPRRHGGHYVASIRRAGNPPAGGEDRRQCSGQPEQDAPSAQLCQRLRHPARTGRWLRVGDGSAEESQRRLHRIRRLARRTGPRAGHPHARRHRHGLCRSLCGTPRVFVPHAWVQSWVDGRWESYDAALRRFDTAHIALATGDGDPAATSTPRNGSAICASTASSSAMTDAARSRPDPARRRPALTPRSAGERPRTPLN